jgi:small subunit ribosomal protein S6
MAKKTEKTEKTETEKPAAPKAAPAKPTPVAKADNKYEGMFLLGAAATADVDKSLALVRGIIERHGGKLLVLKKWDERKLSYEIKGQKRGLYVISYFTAPGSSIVSMERDVSLSEEVLRVLITDAEHLNQAEMDAVEPQPIVPREERAPWDRPFESTGRDNRGDSRGGDRGGDRGFDRGADRPPRPAREPMPAGADKD